MQEQKYPHLFSPIILGNTFFRNRIFASPTGHLNHYGQYLNGGAAAYYGRKAREISSAGVLCEQEAAEKLFSADTIVYAVGQKPLRSEAAALNFCAPEFHMIGDCITSRNITDAVTEAFMTARNIGRF
jgi:hypothetical protein